MEPAVRLARETKPGAGPSWLPVMPPCGQSWALALGSTQCFPLTTLPTFQPVQNCKAVKTTPLKSNINWRKEKRARSLTACRIATWSWKLRDVPPQPPGRLPGAAGLGWGPLLPFVLLHQGPHAPVWILDLLVHAAVPKVGGHQQRKGCQSFRSTQQELRDGHSQSAKGRKRRKAKSLP